MAEKKYRNMKEFYPFYLGEHMNAVCRTLHFIGTLSGLICFGFAIYLERAWIVLFGLAFGYACAWVGHFIFEKNRPATFKYPLLSFMSDFLMFFHLLTGKESFNPSSATAKGSSG